MPTSDIFQQLQQSRGSLGSMGGQNQSQQPQSVLIQPAVPLNNRSPLERSRLEQIISYRAGAKLQQFGYDQLGHGQAVTIPMSGAIQDNYVLGPDDEIVVSLRGQENNEFRAIVDRNGQVIIPRLKPISAAGRSLGSFRTDLDAAVHRSYVATDVSASVGRVRQVSVLVSGEVNQPGQRLVTGLSSTLDALLLSGGVRKTGSLRNVRILRGGKEFSVDLYSVLTDQGVASSMPLADGDRILVPPLGPTVSVSGLVRKPGIYELKRNSPSLTVKELMVLAGGPEVHGQYRLSLLQEMKDGSNNMLSLSERDGVVHDGEILFVQLNASKTNTQVTLSGATGLAGSYPIQSATKISDVLRSPGALGASPYSLFGVVVSRDAKTLLRTLKPYTPVAVINGREDFSLRDDDVIKVFSTNEIQLLEFITRQYLQSLTIDITKIRNPLVSSDANLSGNIINNSASQVSQNFDRLNAINSGISQIDINDIALIPADIQRNEVLSLLDIAAPGTQLARAQAQIRRRDLLAQGGGAGQYNNQTGPNNNLTSQNNAQSAPNKNTVSNPNLDPIPYLPDDKFGGDKERIFDRNGTAASSMTQPGMANQMPDQDQEGNLSFSNTQNTPGIVPAQNFMDQSTSLNGFSYNREANTFGDLSRQLNVDPLILINFLVDHRANLDGAVRGAGAYFVGPNVSLDELVQAAGGTVNWANENGVELISTLVDGASGSSKTGHLTLPMKQGLLASYTVRPHDQFHFPKVFTDVGLGSVSVQGEVRAPGLFKIVRGDHLSDLLRRAGGLTSTAFPYGTVFLRKSAAEIEHQGYLRAAREANEGLAVAMTRAGNDKIDPNAFASLQTFIADIRNQKGIGRISVEADPAVLASQPQIDPLLEDGDVVYIPQRPSTVTVIGQVLQPGSYPYRSGYSLDDYLKKAGGYSTAAEEGMTFLVLPDGSARRVERSWLSAFDTDKLPPGSSIVVPRQVTVLSTRQIVTDVTQIFSQLAVTAASLAVLSRQ